MPSEWFRNVVIIEGAAHPGEVLVEGYQLRPDDVEGFAGWSGLYIDRLAGGGVLLSTGNQIIGRVQLGDYVMKESGTVVIETADGFATRWTKA